MKWRTYVNSILGNQTSDTLIDDLDGKSGHLDAILKGFCEAAWRVRLPIHCFYEQRPTTLGKAMHLPGAGKAEILSHQHSTYELT